MNILTEPAAFYWERETIYTGELERWKKRRNLITVSRVALFLALIWGVYAMITRNTELWLWLEGDFLVLFILLGIADRRVSGKIRLLTELVRCCRAESAYLAGDFSGLDEGGEEFADPLHAYACDMDLFGADSLFRRLDRSATRGGRTLLARWLLDLCRDKEEILTRQQAVAELAAMPGWRLRFRAAGRVRGTEKTDTAGIERWAEEEFPFGSRAARIACYLSNAVTIGAWIAAIAGWGSYGVAVGLFILQAAVVGIYTKRINRIHSRLNGLVRGLEGYTQMMELVAGADFTSERLRSLQAVLSAGQHGALKAFRRLTRTLESFDQRGNLLAAVLLNGLYMRDIHLVMTLGGWRAKYGMRIAEWFSALARIDALCGMAAFRFNHPEYIFPEITDEVLFRAEGLGHPMLRGERVTNDFEVGRLHELYIVTGANMAGKSTFLRTVGVNLILALSGNVVCARRLSCAPMGLFTSMCTTDNLSSGTSYFHAELLRLQQLVGAAGREERLFIILDEMLKGTNSHDKLNGSLRFLEKLLRYPVAGLVATHDLALGELAGRYPDHFRNVCFEIGHTADDIVYDYKLHPGVSQNMNASILLEKMNLI